MKRREQSQTEQLRQALSEREAQLREAQARLAALEGSTSLQVGRALTAAAKRPGRGLVRLPRDLFRLWRKSGTTRQSAGGRRRPQPVRSYDAERQEARLLAGNIGNRDDRLVVAGVLSPEVHAAVEPYVRVIALRPQDAQVVFESVDVDAVLVSASAAATGSLWAHVGDPSSGDRTRALNWLVEAAASRGVPSILLNDAPAPPALATLPFDLVHDGGVGVPLHRFNPIAAEPERQADPVHLPSVGNSGVVANRLVDMLVRDSGLRRADPGWAEEPATLRAASTVVVDDPALADRAMACGARALLLGGSPEEDAEPPNGAGRAPGSVRVPVDASALSSGAAAEGLARVRAAGPLSPEELRLVLRSVFLTDATPVRLADILGRVDFAPGSGSPSASLRIRQVSVLAAPADDITALAFADDILNQEYAPAEIVLPDGVDHLAGVARLRSAGIPMRTVRGIDTDAESGSAPGPAAWAALARGATSPWVALWRAPRGAAFLADVLCAAECSGADAVGPAVPWWGSGAPASADGGDGGSAIDDAVAGQDYVFVSAIEPDLARTQLVRRGLQPGVWNRHGARLLALGPQPDADREAEPGQVGSTPDAG
ncbi:hypothetical protein GCM10009799_26130 [Nocardiopsis rhodophaea]|uniref:Uncharacterized protein n=1 Tax=Nocardiopsis rhodophaea TaxID=280238 RepID=A0ABP5EID3_9ACTN